MVSVYLMTYIFSAKRLETKQCPTLVKVSVAAFQFCQAKDLGQL